MHLRQPFMLTVYTNMLVYIYIYICIYTCVYIYIYTYATQSRDNSTVVHVRFQRAWTAWCFGHRCSKAQSAGSSALISGRNPNENMKSDLGYRRREAAVQNLEPSLHAKTKTTPTHLIWAIAAAKVQDLVPRLQHKA